MQRCPASQQFVEKQLLDIAPYAKDLQLAKVAIHPVPYGNTRETLTETGHYQYECQVRTLTVDVFLTSFCIC